MVAPSLALSLPAEQWWSPYQHPHRSFSFGLHKVEHLVRAFDPFPSASSESGGGHGRSYSSRLLRPKQPKSRTPLCSVPVQFLPPSLWPLLSALCWFLALLPCFSKFLKLSSIETRIWFHRYFCFHQISFSYLRQVFILLFPFCCQESWTQTGISGFRTHFWFEFFRKAFAKIHHVTSWLVQLYYHLIESPLSAIATTIVVFSPQEYW